MEKNTWGNQFATALTKHKCRGQSNIYSLEAPIEVGWQGRNAEIDSSFLKIVGQATWTARGRGFANSLKNALFLTRSPIEKAMLSALIVAGYETAKHVRVRYVDTRKNIRELGDDGSSYPFLLIEAQKRIAGFHVDFFLSYVTDGIEGSATSEGAVFFGDLVIECDGHDYHDRTKEQASLDRKRDRILQQLGCRVFRYTGRDIWADVFECAREALGAVSSQNSLTKTPRLETKELRI